MILDQLSPRIYSRRIVHYDTALPEEIMAHVQQSGFNEAVVLLTDGTNPLGDGNYAQYSVEINLLDIPTLVADLEASGAEWLEQVKTKADEEKAEAVRYERNRLLDSSDKHMILDRQGITVPEGSTFTEWLGFLKSIGQMLKGPWAVYRQALRDIPEQPGFPWDVEWPTKPEE